MSFDIKKNTECRLRDGVLLRADVYCPSGKGRHPVLICRTPYDKSHPRYVRIASEIATMGYIAVVQDIRGRCESEGEWVWHMTKEGQKVESLDGYDACEWAADLKGSNGKVGTWGNSYPSWLIWRMSAARPPSLKAIFTSGFSVRTLECTYGVFETGVRLRWQHHMAVSSRARIGDMAYPTSTEDANHYWDNILRSKWLWHIPLNEVPDALFGPTAGMQRQYWQEIAEEHWNIDQIHPHVNVPTCTLTGWWDRLNAAVGHFSGMVTTGPEEKRSSHRLIIGPWVHDVEGKGDLGGLRSYGSNAVCNLSRRLIRWYDHHLKFIDNGVADEGPVQIFILNDNRWCNVPSWPPPGMEELPLYLHSNGAANTPAGNGSLSIDAPGLEPPDTYTYDPSNPVMSLVESDGQVSACDQKPLAARRDILVYQTPPLKEQILLAGPVKLVLYAASDCPDTDFIARLIEVDAKGLAVNIAQGLIRGRYRNGYDREVTLVQGETNELLIRISVVGIRFRRGSRIRLDITSSDFPKFDRNHNTGDPFHIDTKLRIAQQTILHDMTYPSHLKLPVITDESEWS